MLKSSFVGTRQHGHGNSHAGHGDMIADFKKFLLQTNALALNAISERVFTPKRVSLMVNELQAKSRRKRRRMPDRIIPTHTFSKFCASLFPRGQSMRTLAADTTFCHLSISRLTNAAVCSGVIISGSIARAARRSM